MYSDYVLSVTSLDTSEHSPIPMDGPFGDSGERERRTGFTFGFEDIRRSEIPWFAFHYYGLNAISVLAIDKNYYQFLQQIFSPPADIKEYKYNLKGGIGVFGSAAMDAVQQWRYRPILLNGQPIDVVTTIIVNFSLL